MTTLVRELTFRWSESMDFTEAPVAWIPERRTFASEAERIDREERQVFFEARARFRAWAIEHAEVTDLIAKRPMGPRQLEFWRRHGPGPWDRELDQEEAGLGHDVGGLAIQALLRLPDAMAEFEQDQLKDIERTRLAELRDTRQANDQLWQDVWTTAPDRDHWCAVFTWPNEVALVQNGGPGRWPAWINPFGSPRLIDCRFGATLRAAGATDGWSTSQPVLLDRKWNPVETHGYLHVEAQAPDPSAAATSGADLCRGPGDALYASERAADALKAARLPGLKVA